MNRRLPRAIAFAAVILGFLPLRDVSAGECCTDTVTGYAGMKASSLTRSLAAGVLQPVNGDEEFFNASAVSGPSAPSSIMFLLDNSGSMTDFPQCSGGWGSGNCNPVPAAPSDPSGTFAPTVSTTCTYSGTSAWINNITPTTTDADPGYDDGTVGGVTYLRDAPPWSAAGGCTGNNCLFQDTAVYAYDSWNETSATPSSDPYRRYDVGDDAVADNDYYGNPITAGTACDTCMSSKGICTFTVRYVSNVDWRGRRTLTSWTATRFRGTWLNANPPKYVAARKAVKNLLRITPAEPKLRDKVRYGLSTFWNVNANGTDRNNANGGSSAGILAGDGATLVVPLGPDCASTTTAGYVQNRQAIINAINGNTSTTRIRFSGNTPLAESLFNIAQYFAEPGAIGTFEQRFTSLWAKEGQPGGITYWAGQDFRQCSPGKVGASWTGTCNADDTGTNDDQKSICWACQVSSAIVVTDGMPNNESGLPMAGVTTSHPLNPNPSGLWDFQYWTPTAYATACAANRNTSSDRCKSYLPLVALYMNANDMIPDTRMDTPQNIVVHAISFGISDVQALAVLNATASLGGGIFANTNDTAELEQALVRAVNNVVSRQTAFSSANSNALQTNRNQASETYFARFKPGTTPSWEGHLIEGMLFDEFAMGCDPTRLQSTDTSTVPCGVDCSSGTCVPKMVAPNFNGDIDANGRNRCDGVFLVDAQCREMTERGTDGAFVLADNIDTLADVPWDAGAVLCNPGGAYDGSANPCSTLNARFRSAADVATQQPAPTDRERRKIYTWLGSAAGLTEFRTTDTNDLRALQKAMALDQPWCQQLISDAVACSGTGCHTSATWVQADYDLCAKLVVYYVRGFDVFDLDGDGCRSPVNSAATCPNGEERAWKLGDIFHSTPAVVKPPAHEDVCDTGYDTQCVATIHSPAWAASGTSPQTQIASVAGVDAYQSWRNSLRDRQRVVLVGANDGMLHAFDGGSAISTGDDDDRDQFGSYPYSSGTGEELWAFIPPDLLPRLKLALYAHQYLVDGSTMVRDVWVDGGPSGTGTKDRIKQADEFHTIAVISERSGGTQFTALDVTDPAAPPRYLWTFPPPCGDDARWMGQSWTDFAPRAPPIGPVKIASSATRGFDERWVVMLNGGYDPAMLRGRAVFMVDVWTGATVWRFTGDDVKTVLGSTSPASMFPVPASVGMVDMGDPSTATFNRDGFFDTATWGDMGGNLWVARFHEPGDMTSGRVSNWYAARAFEQQRSSGDEMFARAAAGSTQTRSPFFYMTANAWESQTHTLRTFLGTGNREQMLQKGAACGPDNLFACIQAGCERVETTNTDDFGNGCRHTQRMVYASGQFTYDNSAVSAACASPLVCAAPTDNRYVGRTDYVVTCNGVVHNWSGWLDCNATGTCSSYVELGPGKQFTTGLTTPTFHDRFYGVWSYGAMSGTTLTKKTFNSAATAATFDDNRFSDVAYSGDACGAGVSGTSCSLVDVTWSHVTYDPSNPAATVENGCLSGHSPCTPTASDAGWYYEYGQVCQQPTCNPAPPWQDERTASAANVVLGCAAWSGFRPTASESTTTTGDVCLSTPVSSTSFSYMSDFVTGLPTMSCGFSSDGVIYRSFLRNTWSPPSTASARITFNSQGQVSYSVLNLDPGAPPGQVNVGVEEVGADPVYQLEVPREAHECRHVSSANCK